MSFAAGIILSDLHMGERVFPAQTYGRNAVDHHVLAARLQFCIESALASLPAASELHLCLNGDFVNGIRHLESIETNDLTPMEQLQQVTFHVGESVTKAAAWCSEADAKLFIHCIAGNHGDMAERHQCKNQFGANLDWQAYHQMQANLHRLGPEFGIEVEWDIPDSLFTQWEMCGFTVHMMHGHQPGKRGASARADGPRGCAWPGLRLAERISRQMDSLGLPFDIFIHGHMHWAHSEVFMTWDRYTKRFSRRAIIGNGSIVGYNEYAISSGFDYQPPAQMIFVVEPELGVTEVAPVRCTLESHAP